MARAALNLCRIDAVHQEQNFNVAEIRQSKQSFRTESFGQFNIRLDPAPEIVAQVFARRTHRSNRRDFNGHRVALPSPLLADPLHLRI
jgi:hypothetical protein